MKALFFSLACLPLLAACDSLPGADMLGLEREAPTPTVNITVPEGFQRPQAILVTEPDTDMTAGGSPSIAQSTLEMMRRTVRSELAKSGFDVRDDSIDGLRLTPEAFAGEDLSNLREYGIDGVVLLMPSSLVEDVEIGELDYAGAISAKLMMRQVDAPAMVRGDFKVKVSGDDKDRVLEDTRSASVFFVRQLAKELQQ